MRSLSRRSLKIQCVVLGPIAEVGGSASPIPRGEDASVWAVSSKLTCRDSRAVYLTSFLPTRNCSLPDYPGRCCHVPSPQFSVSVPSLQARNMSDFYDEVAGSNGSILADPIIDTNRHPPALLLFRQFSSEAYVDRNEPIADTGRVRTAGDANEKVISGVRAGGSLWLRTLSQVADVPSRSHRSGILGDHP